MKNLIIGSLVYNEEKKFLKKWLDKAQKLTDKIVIVDDGSTDNSISICNKYTSNIFQTDRLMTKDESKLRKILWDKCCEQCQDGDFILINDCDELPTENSIIHFEECLQIINKMGADSLGWTKYDMWNQTQYREDPPIWKAHFNFLVWCVKFHKNYTYYWNDRKLHCGSLPLNSYYNIFPSKLQIQHMAYSTLELRKNKYNFYNNLDKDGIWGIKAQYESILDQNPTLIDFKDNFEDINE